MLYCAVVVCCWGVCYNGHMVGCMKIYYRGIRTWLSMMTGMTVKQLFFLPVGIILLSAAKCHADTINVHQVRVGHGNCVLIDMNGTKRIMIDTASAAGVPVVTEYLQSQNITTVDWLIVSHAHQDHFGGTAGLISNGITFLSVWDNGHITSNSFVDPAMAAAYNAAVGSIRQTITAGWAQTAGPDTHLRCLYVNGEYADGTIFDYDSVENNASAVMHLEHGNYTHLFPGDIYASVEPHIGLLAGALSVLTVAHHGLNTSTTQEFIRLTEPLASLISMPESDAFPIDAVAGRLQNAGSHVYLTRQEFDIRGDSRTNIIVITDGQDVFTILPADEYSIPESSWVAACICLALAARRL